MTEPVEKKKSPNRLIVDDALLNDDNSVIGLSEAKMEELGIFF